MTLLYNIIPAHIYISLCTASWSLIASLQALAGFFLTMVILRALLDVGEAAFSPGCPSCCLSSSSAMNWPVGRDFASRRRRLLPLSLVALRGRSPRLGMALPIADWRLLFLVEGFPSIIVAVIAWFEIPETADRARYPIPREGGIARLRLEGETGSSEEGCW